VKIANSSRRHPRKFGLKRFLAVRKVLVGKKGSLFLGYLLGKNFPRLTAIVSYRPGGWQQHRAEACYTSGRKHGEVLGSETARLHHAARRRGSVAARRARAARRFI
jgi:hypothetical protein